LKTSDFVTLLQNEFVLSRDPHVVSRFVELLEENFGPKHPNTGFPDLATHEQEPSVSDPTAESLVTERVISEPESSNSAPSSTSEASESTPEAGSSSPQQTESEAS
jgi:hypothetical protein